MFTYAAALYLCCLAAYCNAPTQIYMSFHFDHPVNGLSSGDVIKCNNFQLLKGNFENKHCTMHFVTNTATTPYEHDPR